VIERSVALTSEVALDAKAIRIGDGLSIPDLDRAESESDEHQLCKNAAIEGITLKELEQIYIEEVLQLTGGNKSDAARILGINRATLYRRKG